MENIKISRNLFEKPPIDMGVYIAYVESRDIIHYSITSIGSYVFPKFPTSRRKGDSITMYHSEQQKFHMTGGKHLVYNGDDWCLLCETCKTEDDVMKHTIQINREKKLITLL